MSGSGARHLTQLALRNGSQGRIPLSAFLRKRYGSNLGLARARAEKVRERMLACLNAAAPILTITPGPVHTPELIGREMPGGAEQDRKCRGLGFVERPGRNSREVMQSQPLMPRSIESSRSGWLQAH